MWLFIGTRMLSKCWGRGVAFPASALSDLVPASWRRRYCGIEVLPIGKLRDLGWYEEEEEGNVSALVSFFLERQSKKRERGDRWPIS